jgi:hypothetical protein
VADVTPTTARCLRHKPVAFGITGGKRGDSELSGISPPAESLLDNFKIANLSR